jgi:hypothetical protein
MQTITLKDDLSPASLILALDSGNTNATLLATAGPEVTQNARIEFDYLAFSVSLLNSSDLGLVVDNNGRTTIHDLAVEGAFSANGGQVAVNGVNDMVFQTGGPVVTGDDGITKYRLKVDTHGAVYTEVVT